MGHNTRGNASRQRIEQVLDRVGMFVRATQNQWFVGAKLKVFQMSLFLPQPLKILNACLVDTPGNPFIAYPEFAFCQARIFLSLVPINFL
jgi:hypothetical protein